MTAAPGPWRLWKKVLCLALLNFVLLGVVVLAFARAQFRLGQESLLMGPARDRIVAIATAFNMEFTGTAPSGRDALLAAYSKRYGADFFLTDPDGDAIAGPRVDLPPELIDRLHQRAPMPPPPKEEPPPDRPRPRRPEPRGLPPQASFLVITHDPTSYWAGARIPVSLEEGRIRPGVLLVRAGSMFNSDLFFDWRLWLGVALSIVAVSALCWVPFIRGLTRSIAQMDRVTEQIAEGQFDARVAHRRHDELGHLGEQINRLAARLQSFVKGQKRFLGDIAHELCAPIARIQVALGILEQTAAAEDQPRVAVLHQEIQEMSSLVTELLSFSRAGLQQTATPLTRVHLASLAERAATREAPSPASIQVAVDTSLAAMANESLLLRALSNLLRNAVRYAGQSGPITLSASRYGDDVSLTVADHGPGLPESDLEEIFAPFYRSETARTRETGGVGLGLAIVKTCVEACRGTVRCRNRRPSGLEVELRLKAAP
jgi:two-component system sensor histidine kinase CpxA